jgi:hypothetical protein
VVFTTSLFLNSISTTQASIVDKRKPAIKSALTTHGRISQIIVDENQFRINVLSNFGIMKMVYCNKSMEESRG